MTKNHDEVSERTYLAIGRFIFEFSQAEYTIRHYLGDLIGIKDEYFSAIIETISVGQLCNITKDVVAGPNGHRNAEKINKLVSKFERFNRTRNQVAHGLWVPFMDGGTVHHVPANKPQPRRASDQAASLEQDADEVRALRAALDRAFTELPEQGAP